MSQAAHGGNWAHAAKLDHEPHGRRDFGSPIPNPAVAPARAPLYRDPTSRELLLNLSALGLDNDGIARRIAAHRGLAGALGHALRELVDPVPDDDQPPQRGVETYGSLAVERANYRALVNGQDVHLTATEFRLLAMLCARRNRVQSRAELIRGAWQYEAHRDPRTVDTHIKRLRGKLGSARHFIQTVRGFGYCFRFGD